MRQTLSMQVFGRVQGVGFRYYTKKKAIECNVNGFVQNKADGSVYLEASGDEIDLETFVDWCRQGPTWARVLKTSVSELPTKDWNGFEIR
ncbi:MAG: acylphosphatase [Bacteroidales bacterium]|nr:acylphosphatase [Bacteroidales bacterium]